MKTIDDMTVPADVSADMQAVVESLASGRPLDPETFRRIRARGRKITEELRQQYGELDIAVPAVREFRGELPE